MTAEAATRTRENVLEPSVKGLDVSVAPKPRAVRTACLWTKAEDELLATMIEEHKPYKTIAERLGRTPAGIKLRVYKTLRTGLLAPEYGDSIKSTSWKLGIAYETVMKWITRDWLHVHHVSPRHRLIEEHAIISFLENPEHWHEWNPDALRDPDLKEWALELRSEVEYLSMQQAAARLGIAYGTMVQWVREGKVQSVRGRSNHVSIRADWLTSAPVPGVMATGFLHRVFTLDEIAFLILWRPVQPLVALAAALDRSWSSVSHVCDRLGLTGPAMLTTLNLRPHRANSSPEVYRLALPSLEA